jgi:hypothetical protein
MAYLEYYKQTFGQPVVPGSNPTKDLTDSNITYTLLQIDSPENNPREFLGLRIDKESNLGKFLSSYQSTSMQDYLSSKLPHCDAVRIDASYKGYIDINCFAPHGTNLLPIMDYLQKSLSNLAFEAELITDQTHNFFDFL